MKEDQPLRISYRPPAAYLDMARSMFGQIQYYEAADQNSPEFMNSLHNCLFSVMSVSIVFSYQAVEAECNGQLHRIYTHSDSSTIRYRKLIEQCRDVPSFEKIKREEKLGEKIKMLCKCLGIRTPHEADSTNWNRFKQITEVMRHFIIHPDPEKFQEECSKIMQEIKSGTYVSVAENIIKHFYVETGSTVPHWVEASTIFKCHGFELLPLKKENI